MPNWREFNSDGTIENQYLKDNNNTYTVKEEYDLRFHCTWTRIGKFAL